MEAFLRHYHVFSGGDLDAEVVLVRSRLVCRKLYGIESGIWWISSRLIPVSTWTSEQSQHSVPDLPLVRI